jgi:hypothetical protein
MIVPKQPNLVFFAAKTAAIKAIMFFIALKIELVFPV